MSDLETALRRVVSGYRGAAVLWMLLLVVLGGLPPGRDPRQVAVVVVALAGAWAVVAALVSARRPAWLRRVPWLVADAAVAAVTVLGPLAVAVAADVRVGAIVPFAGGYPFAAVLSAAVFRGAGAGLGVAALLSAATVLRVAPLGTWRMGEALPSVLVYVAGAAVVAWGARLLRRQDTERRQALLALAEERAALERERERAETAAHLHDSVLQTLALLQRRADDAGEVRTLARRQERALRDWLAGRPAPGEGERRFAAALTERCGAVEQEFDVPVEVVTVGDATLDERLDALAAASAEAVRNAARHSGAPKVEVYAEVREDAAEVFVRDRGAGFDPAAVAAERRGVRESIEGRMRRHGGQARLRGGPGQGTEWELRLPRRERRDQGGRDDA